MAQIVKLGMSDFARRMSAVVEIALVRRPWISAPFKMFDPLRRYIRRKRLSKDHPYDAADVFMSYLVTEIARSKEISMAQVVKARRPASVGQIWAIFETITVIHPRMEVAFQFFDALRLTKQLSPNAQKRFGTMFAATQSGKSKTVEAYIRTVIVDEVIRRGDFPADMDRERIAEEQKLVIHVTLSSKSTPKSLASDILRAFGDPLAAKGTENSLLQRVYDYLRFHGTELVFIDEIQHLSIHKSRGNDGREARSGISQTTSTTDALKVMLIRGLVPMMMIGIKEARPHLFNDTQLAARCLDELDFSPLNFSDPTNNELFVHFIGRFGAQLSVNGVFGGWALLLKDDVPNCLHEVAGGRLGMVVNLLRKACEIPIRDPAAIEITREHLSAAVVEWAIPRGIINYNPFDKGVRAAKLRRTERRADRKAA